MSYAAGVPSCLAISQVDRRPKRVQSIRITLLNLPKSVLQLLSSPQNNLFKILPVIVYLSFEIFLVQRTLETYGDDFNLQRLDEVVIGALPHGLYAKSNIVDSRGHQEDQTGIVLPDLIHQLQAPNPRHI